jgi:hypothetical protein
MAAAGETNDPLDRIFLISRETIAADKRTFNMVTYHPSNRRTASIPGNGILRPETFANGASARSRPPDKRGDLRVPPLRGRGKRAAFRAAPFITAAAA